MELQQPLAAAAAATSSTMLSPLLGLPPDMWRCCILPLVDPRDVCALSCASQQAARLAAGRRRGVLLARVMGRLHLRAVRQAMTARSTFVLKACSLERLEAMDSCQAQLLEALERSPDPIPDLAAAIQRGLALLTTQTDLHGSIAAPLRADLVRCANFVCLLAWRQHMGKMRRRAAAAAAAAAAGHAAAAAVEPMAAAAPAGAVAVPNNHPQQEQQQQEQEAVAPLAAVQATAVQTELGPSLQELQELLSGFSILMAAAGNPSLMMLRPSLNLLHHMLVQQLRAWNLPAGAVVDVEAAADAADAAAVVEVVDDAAAVEPGDA